MRYVKNNSILSCDSDRALLLSCLPKLNKAEKKDLENLLSIAVQCEISTINEKIISLLIKKDDPSFNERWYNSDTMRAIFDQGDKARKFEEQCKKDFPQNYHTMAFSFTKLIGEATRERSAFVNYHTVPNDLLSNFIVVPKIENERQKIQQGIFAIFGIENEFCKQDNFEITKFIISSGKNGEKKEEILKQLNRLGINKSTLFRDLENRANYLLGK